MIGLFPRSHLLNFICALSGILCYPYSWGWEPGPSHQAPNLTHTNPHCSRPLCLDLYRPLQFTELCSSLALSPCLFSIWSSFKHLHLHLQTLFLRRNLSLYFITACSRGKIKLSLKTSNLSKPLKLMRKCLWKWELLPQMLEQKCLYPVPMPVYIAALQVMQVPKSKAACHEFHAVLAHPLAPQSISVLLGST